MIYIDCPIFKVNISVRQSAQLGDTKPCSKQNDKLVIILVINLIAFHESKNRGASKATGDMLIFADADLILPEYFLQKFEEQINKKHLQVGSFLQRMQSNKFGIRAGAYLMNAYARLMQHTPWPIGFGCLYVTREVFDSVNGFDTSLFIMEDYDLILKAKRAKYKNGVIKIAYLTSDRRYQNNSLRQALKGIYGELYRYTHGLRVTKRIYEYEMGGKQKKTTK